MAVVLLSPGGAGLDGELLALLEARLAAAGHRVFADRLPAPGLEAARQIESQIRKADVVIPLLSPSSIRSEMLAYEIEVAHQAARQQGGRPRLLPVRVKDTGPLPEETLLPQILDPLEQFLWRGPRDTARLVNGLLDALDESKSVVRSAYFVSGRVNDDRTPLPDVKYALHNTPPALPPAGGVVPLDSLFYIVRETDAAFHDAIACQEGIVLVKGARQMGKTSLLARGLQRAREAGARVVLTDFQMLDPADLESADRLFRAMGELLADQLELEVFPDEVWRPHLGSNMNIERYLGRHVLEKIEAPLVWGLDEIDRLFSADFGTQVFGLFRSWYNRRGLDPAGPWSRLTLAIAYATEAHLFITDVNQSPFNVGTRLALEDFTLAQVADLNGRCGSPLRDAGEVARFHRLVNGHPYLVSRGLREMITRGLDIRSLEAQACRDDGVFGDHLRRLLVTIANDPERCAAVRAVLNGQPCPSAEAFYRLRSAGVLAGESSHSARLRCPLYVSYLEQRLL